MSDINKCADCGRFKPWDELQGCAGDSDDLGHYEYWFECVDCISGNDLREFTKKKIEKISALQAELKLKDEKLSELTHGLPIEKAKEGRKWVLAKFKDDLSHVTFAEQFEGRWMVIRHGGFAEDGYDFGWGFVGHGGFSDECFEKLLSLPSQNSQTQEGS